MMQVPTVYPSGTHDGPTFECLFAGGALVEEEFGGCSLLFACDKIYKNDPIPSFLSSYERVKWIKQHDVDFLVVK